MRVVVLGAGIIGVTTACYLAKNGFDVTVIDRADDIASGASYANGGQLSYSFTDALARPGMPRTLPGLIIGKDHAIRVRPSMDLGLLRWGSDFLRQCSRKNFRENTVAVLQLALQSSVLLDELVREFNIDFAFRAAGKMVLLRALADVRAAEESVALKNQHGCSVRLLKMSDACEIEPSLSAMRSGYLAAVYSENDQVGDARLFARELAGCLRMRFGVAFLLAREAIELIRENGRVTGVRLVDGELPADAVVNCLGAWAAAFAGLSRGEIQPVRGYSITLPPGKHAPAVSISDVEHRIVFSRLGETVRIAGFADFIGFNEADDIYRVDRMLRLARKVAPDAADYAAEDRREWGGFRPMTANSRPIIGSTTVPGLYLNCGHGMLGWTLACASAFHIAQQISR